jgi:hypothetical protein
MRSMLLDMGGPEAIPAASDTIDMVAILRELTMPEMFLESSEGESGVLYSRCFLGRSNELRARHFNPICLMISAISSKDYPPP